MRIELDERKVRYFEEQIAPRAGVGLEQLIDNLFRTYLEQVGLQLRVEKTYAAWLEECLGNPCAKVEGNGD